MKALLEVKKCTKCGEEKAIGLFNKNKCLKSGISNICKVCSYAICLDYKDKNKEKYKEYHRYIQKKYYQKNKDRVLEKNRIWRIQNPERDKILNNTRQTKDRIELGDKYVKLQLYNLNIPITPETINLKREIIKLKRLTR